MSDLCATLEKLLDANSNEFDKFIVRACKFYTDCLNGEEDSTYANFPIFLRYQIALELDRMSESERDFVFFMNNILLSVNEYENSKLGYIKAMKEYASMFSTYVFYSIKIYECIYLSSCFSEMKEKFEIELCYFSKIENSRYHTETVQVAIYECEHMREKIVEIANHYKSYRYELLNEIKFDLSSGDKELPNLIRLVSSDDRNDPEIVASKFGYLGYQESFLKLTELINDSMFKPISLLKTDSKEQIDKSFLEERRLVGNESFLKCQKFISRCKECAKEVRYEYFKELLPSTPECSFLDTL